VTSLFELSIVTFDREFKYWGWVGQGGGGQAPIRIWHEKVT
jgi:hypothetical protein